MPRGNARQKRNTSLKRDAPTRHRLTGDLYEAQQMLKDYREAWPKLRHAFQTIARICDGTMIDAEKVKAVRKVCADQGIR